MKKLIRPILLWGLTKHYGPIMDAAHDPPADAHLQHVDLRPWVLRAIGVMSVTVALVVSFVLIALPIVAVIVVAGYFFGYERALNTAAWIMVIGAFAMPMLIGIPRAEIRHRRTRRSLAERITGCHGPVRYRYWSNSYVCACGASAHYEAVEVAAIIGLFLMRYGAVKKNLVDTPEFRLNLFDLHCVAMEAAMTKRPLHLDMRSRT